VSGKALARTVAETMTEDIREEYRKFAVDTLRAAKHILARGTPGAKERLVRSIVPTVVRDTLAEKTEDEDETMKELRERIDAVHATVREGLAAAPRALEADDEDMPEDRPA
jgi:hypothetical protein